MHPPRAIALTFLLAGAAHAQEALWETYRAANTLAQAEAWAAALPKFKAVVEVATEPALRAAACYGVGLAAHALVSAEPDQKLACEGVEAIDCFLAGEPPPAKALALANERRAALQAVCEPAPPPPPPPPPPVDRTAAIWTTVGAGASALAGGVLVGLAFADAADVREKRRMNISDTALEDSAQAKVVSGYTLLGVGAALGGIATWLWLRDDTAETAIRPAGLGIGGRF